MKHLRWQIILGVSFIALSTLFYLIQIVVFRAPRDTFFYLFQDLAFVPVQVLLVTLIINRLLGEREKRSRLEKLNMVIGVFFSEAGRDLLVYLSDADPRLEEIRRDLVVSEGWSENKFALVSRGLKEYDYGIDIEKIDLPYLRSFLTGKRDLFVQLIENPNLHEHETFTDLLLAVFHLVEELSFREDFAHLPESDRVHLTGDMKRVYALLAYEWLAYMRHLKDNYPYLFSLAMRTNPFDETASPVVK